MLVWPSNCLGKSQWAVLTNMLNKPLFLSSTAVFTEPNQLSVTTHLPLPWYGYVSLSDVAVVAPYSFTWVLFAIKSLPLYSSRFKTINVITCLTYFWSRVTYWSWLSNNFDLSFQIAMKGFDHTFIKSQVWSWHHRVLDIFIDCVNKVKNLLVCIFCIGKLLGIGEFQQICGW